MFFFEPLYLLFASPGLWLGLWAQWRVKNIFQQYSQVRLTRQQTGAQIARQILQRSGVSHIDVECMDGFSSDHYDPHSKVLRLSSLTAAGLRHTRPDANRQLR